MRYRYFVDFWHGISVFTNFSHGIAVFNQFNLILRGNVRRPRTDRYNERKRYPTNISSQIICQKLCNGNHLPLIYSLKNTDVHKTSLRSRRLEVVGQERTVGREGDTRVVIQTPATQASMKQERAMNSSAIPWRIFFYRIPLTKRMKNRIRHTAGVNDTAIPHFKIQITEILLEKKLNIAIP